MSISVNLSKVLALISVGFKTYGIATSILLTWLMKADGKTSTDELKILDDYLRQFGLEENRALIFKIVDDFDYDSIEFASEVLRRELTIEGKRLTMDLFLGMVVADGYITFTEMYVIEFIADLFGYSPEVLNQIFIEATGRPKLDHGNPSSKLWWENRNKRSSYERNEKQEQEKNKQQSAYGNTTSLKRQQSFAILGLDVSATQKEIKDAFRLLSKIHHPDRFHKLGDEAKKSANKTYIRIKDAYEYLMTA